MKDEVEVAELVVSPRYGGQQKERRQKVLLPAEISWIPKISSYKVVSAATALFILLVFIVVTNVYTYTQGIDIISAFTSTSIGRTFQAINTWPSDYPHIDEHPFNCTNSNLNLTCPANYRNWKPSFSLSAPNSCPDYFRWIHEDLKQWKKDGITREMVEEVEKNPSFRHFRLVIVNGTAYVKQYDRAFQTRDVFTLWGVLQLLKMYPGRIPDLDLVFQCHDTPSIRKDQYKAEKAPPLFHYCGSDDTYDIVFPDWSFWGWPEINIKPWAFLKEDLEQGNRIVNWTDREPYAYWKGNLYTGARTKLVSCNSIKNFNTLIIQQDWKRETQGGFKNSDMSKQCTHKYKIYMEGHAWSVSEKYVLACDSMSLLVNPIFYEFFTRSLVPLKHYWPINPNNLCNALKFAVDWGNNHHKKAQEIGKAGSRFVQQELSMQNVYDYMFHLLSEYGKLLRYKPTIPSEAVELCSEKWVCTPNELERRFKQETLVQGPAMTEPCTLPPPFKPQALKILTEEKASAIKQVEKWEQEGMIN